VRCQQLSLSKPHHSNFLGRLSPPKCSKCRPFFKSSEKFLLNKELPHDTKCQSLIKLFANDCFIENDIIWRRIKRQFEPSRVVIFLPASLKQEALIDAHGHQLVGHDGIYKTKEWLLLAWYGFWYCKSPKSLPNVKFDTLMIARRLPCCPACRSQQNQTSASMLIFLDP